MINGVSVYVKSQEAFAADAIKKLEESIFTESSKGSSVTIHQREPKKIIRDVVKSIKTEEETCLMHGLQYLRIPLVDHKVPTTEQIDLFVDLVDQLQDTWLHFHCRKGLGRSTTFMTLYDILKNGHVVTLDEILHRQRAMGGANLTHEKAYGEHHRLLKEFYAFAKDHRAGHAPRWSKWKKKRH
jgi:protein-tyrosine phosphatase